MSIPTRWRYAAFFGLCVAAVLPWIGHRVRLHPHTRCALDGAEINREMRVRILAGRQGEWQFCSLFCAEKWLQASRLQPDAILVIDETTGEELDAGSVFFVRSQVISHAPTSERRHVFRLQQDAKSHADSHLGHILLDDERPFAAWLNRRPQPVARQFASPEALPKRDLSEP